MNDLHGRRQAMDLGRQRADLIQTKLPAMGVYDQQVVRAVKNVRREAFIPEDLQKFAYRDSPLPIGEEQTISQPSLVALMTQELHLPSHAKVLEVGTGSGYQTAILAEIADEVYSIEVRKNLSEIAQQTLKNQGYLNIHCKIGDGTKGWASKGPFDGIMVTAVAEEPPQSLLDQLKPGGYMVIPIDEGESQILYRIVKTSQGQIQQTRLFAVRFVPIVAKDPDSH